MDPGGVVAMSLVLVVDGANAKTPSLKRGEATPFERGVQLVLCLAKAEYHEKQGYSPNI